MEHFDAGVHDIPADRYQAAEGVSATMLDILAESTPMHLQCWMNGEKRPETDDLRFGILAHYAILQGDVYKERFHVRPEGHKATTKEGKKWMADHADKPTLTHEEGKRLTGMVEAVRRHPFARRLLVNSLSEQSLFVYDDLQTLRKSRLDILAPGNTIPDLKTCTSANNENFERQILRYRYHVRAAFYIDNCRLLNLDKEHYLFICVEKLPPFAVRCLRLDPDVVTWGRKLYQGDLQTWRQCLDNDDWPGYEEGFADIMLPQWEMRRIYELI